MDFKIQDNPVKSLPYGLDNQGSLARRGTDPFASPQCLD
jgi:hypothetical protein